MGRRNRVEIRHSLQYIVGQILHTGYTLGMHDLETNTGNVVQRTDAAVKQMPEHGADGFFMGGENHFFPDTAAVDAAFMVKHAFCRADTLGTEQVKCKIPFGSTRYLDHSI